MKPVSRGAPPEQYTLTVPCHMPHEYVITDQGQSTEILVGGFSTTITSIDAGFRIEVTGLPTIKDARAFFNGLIRTLLRRSMAATIPFTLRAHGVTELESVTLPQGNVIAAAAGWPENATVYKVLDSQRAQIYPEHDYVVTDGTFRTHVRHSISLSQLAEQLLEGGPPVADHRPVDERVCLAAFAYTHAARTFQPVWGFLQVMMALEMLTHYLAISGKPTQRFIKLVETYCAPGMATIPLIAHYPTQQACTAKAEAIYDLRSRYVHDGYVKSVKHGYAFTPLRDAAHATLRHILDQMI